MVRDVKIISFQIRAPDPILRWVDHQAVQMGLSRNQFVVLVLRATQAHLEAAEDVGLFKQVDAIAERAAQSAGPDLLRYATPERKSR